MLITRTGTSRSVAQTCNYIGDYDTKAHANGNGVIKRNQFMMGVGVNVADTKTIKASFDRLSRKSTRSKVKLINYVISPKPNTVSTSDPDDAYNLARYAKRVATTAFPHHLAEVAVQWDNKHAIPHAHLIVSNLSTLPPHRAVDHALITNSRVSRVAEKVRRHGFSAKSDPLVLDKVEDVASPSYHAKVSHSLHSNDLATKATVLENKVVRDSLNYRQAKRYAKSIGLQMKYSRGRARVKHVRNADGTFKRNKYGRKVIKYKRTADGQHYIWRKNKHGNRVRVAERTKARRKLLFRLIPTKSSPASRKKYRSAKWLDLDDDTLQSAFTIKPSKPISAKRDSSTVNDTKTADTDDFEDIPSGIPDQSDTEGLNQESTALTNRDLAEADRKYLAKFDKEGGPDNVINGFANYSPSSFNQADGTVLRDDIELLPALDDKSYHDKALAKSQSAKARKQLDRNNANTTKTNVHLFTKLLNDISTYTEHDYHKTQLIAKHYAKAIHEYFIKLRKKTAKSVDKSLDNGKTFARGLKSKVNDYDKYVKRLYRNKNKSEAIKNDDKTKRPRTKKSKPKHHISKARRQAIVNQFKSRRGGRRITQHNQQKQSNARRFGRGNHPDLN